MKKYLPLVAAAVVFVAAFFLLQPEKTLRVIVLRSDLAAGHTLTADDLGWRDVPASVAPADRVVDPNQVIGQTLRTDRTAGDVVRAAHLGEPVTLAPDERAVAVKVTEASGLAGLLKPGDRVGLTAVIFSQGQTGAYSKVTVEGLRVLYVSPDFRAGYLDTNTQSNSTSGVTVIQQQQRKTEGPVVLAVPVAMQTVVYDFSGQQDTRQVSVLELLAALDAAANARVSLYAMPKNAQAFNTSGLLLPDLILLPTATPTPTETPPGFKATPTPAVTPAKATATPAR